MSLVLTSAVCADTPPHATRESSAAVPTKPNWPQWERRLDETKRLAERDQPPVIFLGDSITENWKSTGKVYWEKYFQPLQAANFGIAGDRTQYLLWRIKQGELAKVQPAVIVLLIGTNNIKEQRNTATDTAQGVSAVVRSIRRSEPQATLLLLGILPCGESSDSQERRDQIAVNREIRNLADDRYVHFLELDAVFVRPNGEIPHALMPDSLHLSKAGYQLLARELHPRVIRFLGEADLLGDLEKVNTAGRPSSPATER